MLITVFTPTYNRAYRLGALYESLCKQTFRDFEWLIVDDGSTDNTRELVEGWISENQIDIRYIAQPNGGKHRAINRGVGNAEGTLFFIVDSDDILPSDSIEQIKSHYQLIKDRSGFGGLCGLKAYYDGSPVGNKPDFGVLECTNYDIRYKYKIKGDLAEVFYTDVMKEFPFPEIDGECFCPEVLVWNRISSKYRIHYFDTPVYYCEYLEDGLTASIVKVRIKSPIGACMTYAELVKAPIPFWVRFRSAINYWRFWRYIGKKESVIIAPLWWLARPFSLIFRVKDRKYI